MASADVDQLKKKRSYAKANVTKSINKITEVAQCSEASDEIREEIAKLRTHFKSLQEIHESLHSQLQSEHEIADSDRYYRDCLESVSRAEALFNDNVSVISSRSSKRSIKPRPKALDFSLYIARQISSIVECCREGVAKRSRIFTLLGTQHSIDVLFE